MRNRAVAAAVFETFESRYCLAAPVVESIPAYTVPVGKTVHIPIRVSYDKADQLTLTSSDNSGLIVTQFRQQTNTWIEMKVAGYDEPMVFQLFNDLTPDTVRRITGLVNSGFYNGLNFHRVINNFVIQGGDPNGDGSGGPGFQFDDEFTAAATFTGDGQLAMANSGKDTNGSQFFVTEGPQRFLDFNHTIFGQLVRGFATRNAISDISVDSQSRPNSVVKITSTRVITNNQDGVLMVKLNGIGSGTVTVAAAGADGTASRSFTVTGVSDAENSPPYLQSLQPVYYTSVNKPITIPLRAVDPEGNAVLYGGEYISQAGATAQIDQANGTLTVTPAAGYVGPITLYVGVATPGASSRGSSGANPNQPLQGIYDTQKITIAVGEGEISAKGVNIIGVSGASANNVIVATFTDTDRNGSSGNFSARINWGDGGISTGAIGRLSPGVYAVYGSHAYADAAADASYPLTVDITGNNGAVAQTQSYAVVSSFASTSGGILRVSGTSGADRIGVSRKNSTYYVTVNRQTRTFPASDVTAVHAYSFDGDDLLQLAETGVTGSYLDGGIGNDVIYGSDGDDTINAGAGRDTVHTRDGTNRVAGGDGHDTIWGGIGRDRLFGGTGNDYISGGSGRDILGGDEGNDTLLGGASNDSLYGGAGNDLLNGNNGADYLDGGAGTDQTKVDEKDTARIAMEILV